MSMHRDDVSSWLAYQERINPRLIDLGLERVRPVAQRLGLDDLAAPALVVAGTNGKGSVVAFLEALALEHGLRPGCYSSPWLLRYNESVRVAGEPLEDAALIAAFEAVERARGDETLTAFEFRTLAAVHALREAGVDIFVLEVGLGGRLDAVNLFDAAVGVITSIDRDHEEWLGRDLQQIAEEKAGIARPGVALVCGDSATGAHIARTRGAREAQLVVGGRDFSGRAGRAGWSFQGLGLSLEGLPLPALAGAHQLDNAAAAIAAFTLSGLCPVAAEGVADALLRARLPGRLQRLPGPGERFVDVAHNPHAARALAVWLHGSDRSLPNHAVCAMYADKDAAAVLDAVAGAIDHWYLAPLPPPRGAAVAALEAALPARVPASRRRLFGSVEAAWEAASECGGGSGRVLAFGSFETVRRVLRLESTLADLDT